MAEAHKYVCGPCEYKDKILLATNWCSDCKELLCEECYGSHHAHRNSRGHHVITTAENKLLEALDLPLVEHCALHNMEKDLYCSSHDEIVCLRCTQTDHSKCEPAARLSDAAKNVKNSTLISVLEEDIGDMIKSIRDILQDRERNKKSIDKQKSEINIKIKDIRKFIDQKLDQIEETITEQLQNKYEKSISEVDSTIQVLDDYEKKLHDMKKSIDILKTCASNTQTFIGTRALETKAVQKEELLNSFVELIRDVSLEMEQNLEIFTTCTSMKSFGDIKVESSVLPYTISKRTNLQNPLSMDSVRLSGTLKFNERMRFKLPQEIFQRYLILSCAILPNNQFIFIDKKNKRLIVHNQDGSNAYSTNLANNPFDLAVLGNDKIALSFPWSAPKRIELLNTTDFKTENTIYFKNKCYGLSYENGKLFVVVRNEGILVMDLSGQLWTSIPVDGNGIFYVHVKSDKLYCSDECSDTVQCYDIKGNSIWTYTNSNLRSPRAVTSSENRYVFVSGFRSNNVLALDMNGNLKADIREINNEMNSPVGLYFDIYSGLLLTCNSGNGQAFLYEIA